MKKFLSVVAISSLILVSCNDSRTDSKPEDANASKVEVNGDNVTVDGGGAGVKVEGDNVTVDGGGGAGVTVKNGKVTVSGGAGVNLDPNMDTKAESSPSASVPKFKDAAVQKWVNNYDALHQDLKKAAAAQDAKKVILITNKISIEAPKMGPIAASLSEADAQRLEDWSDNLDT